MKKLSNKLRKGIKMACILSICYPGLINEGQAQILNPFGTSHFQNRYLSNPAMAGLSAHTFDLNVGYRKEGVSIPGSPNNQYFTGTYGLNDRAGLGLNLYNDNAGLFRTTRALGTYAYHVPLNEEKEKLLLGISAGLINIRVDNSGIIGDHDDPGVISFNDNNLQFDANFGIAYTDGKLTAEGAFPGIVNYFQKTDTYTIDKTVFFSALSYRFTFHEENNSIVFEPRVGYRNVKGYDDIIDAGAMISFMDNLLNAFAMYHSTNDVTFGLGLNVEKKFNITAIYSTGASSFKKFTDGSFEIGVGLKLSNSSTK